MSDKFLSIENLSIEYVTEGEVVKAVNGITLSMKKGETLGADAQITKPEIATLVNEIDRLILK